MVVIRRATLDDLDKLVNLRIQFLREAEQVGADTSSTELQRSLRRYLKKHLEDDSFVAWLAQEGEEVIGTSGICFYCVPPTFGNSSGDVGYIMNMWTRPDRRRQGIGQSLLDKLIEEASARGIRKVLLDTTDMGRPLYAKNGFLTRDNDMVRILD